MLGKKGSNPNDDFDFDFGGSDELFSLDDPFGSSKEDKPPKGVKGYLKNVVKSVKNMGVSIGNLYLPDVKYLVDDLKEDDSDNPSLREQARIYKRKGKEYVKMAKDIAKDMSDDIKKRIKTGYFYKSEEDSYDMNFDFNDTFEGDSDLGGLVDDFGDSSEENPAPDSTETGELPESTSDSLSLTMAKSAKASTIASMKMHDDTINATIGATQYHIETENLRFNQSMLVESEHHRQKMIVMKNIASNVGKIVRQNNVSLKAQMEYSVKSLAFSNDMAAMIKEIRDVQWKAFSPKKEEEQEVDLGKKAKVFGNGFNKKEWLKNFKNKSKSEVAGGVFDYFDMAKEMMGSMGDFGMKPADLIKSMIGGSVFEGAMNTILPDSIKKSLQRINRVAEGAPNAINNILGRIGREGLSKDSLLYGALDKMGGVGSFLKNQIKNFASYAHVDDMIVSNTGKYTLKNPEEVHPFDNLAHKTLTEVIPKQLSMIEAGINNSEEKFFDYESNSFKTISSIKNKIEKERENVLEYSQGYTSASNHTKNTLSASESLKDVDLDVEKLNKQLMKNLFRAQTGLKDEDIAGFYKRDANGKLTNEIDLDSDLTNKILNDVDQYSNSELSDQNKKDIVNEFIKGLKNLEKENPEEFINLQNGAGTYATRLSRANIDLENKYGRFGNSIAFDTFTKDEEIDKRIQQSKKRANHWSKLLDEQSFEKGGDKRLRQRTRTRYLNELANIRDLSSYKEGKVGVVNAKEEDNIKYDKDLYNQFKNVTGKNESEIEEKRAELIKNSTINSNADNYELKELKNTSTNSIVSNIYKLLLDGIIVYPRNSMDKDVENKYKLRKNAIESVKKAQIEQKNNELYENLSNKKEGEELAKKRLQNIKRAREEIYEKSLIQEKLEDIPGIGRVFKWMSNITNKTVNTPVKGVADFLEEELYGVHHGTTDKIRTKSEEVVNKGKEKAKKYKDSIKDKGVTQTLKDIKDEALNSKIGKTVTDTMRTVKDTVKDEKDKLSNTFKEDGLKTTVKEAGKDLFNFGKKTKDKIKKSKIGKTVTDTIKDEKDKLSKTDKPITDFSKKTISKTKNLLGPTISNIKSGKTTLAEKVSKIKDTDLLIKLKNAKTQHEEAQLLIDYGGSELEDYKGQLRDYINSIKDKKPNIINRVVNKIRKPKDDEEKTILSKDNLAKESKDNVINNPENRKEGTLQDQKLDKKEEKESEQKESQTKSLATIAATLTGLFKNGFKLDKSTMKEFEENNEELKDGLDNVASKSSSATSGLLGKVNNLIDSSGLGNTKAGKAVKDVLTKTQDTITKGKGVLGKVKGSKLGQKVVNSKIGAITAGIGTSAKGIFKGSFRALKYGGVKGLATHTKRAISKGIGKSLTRNAAKSSAKNKTLIGKFINVLKKFFDLIFKNPKFAKATGKSAVTTIIKNITKHIPSIIGKIAGKITSAIAFLSTGVGALVKFGVGFANGARNVRKTLGLGNDMKPTASMVGICSLAAGLDLVLSEIPTLIAKLAGFKNFAQWLYNMIGSKAEKEALDRYKKYCSMKAAIYGIKDVDGLISYQNRDLLDNAGRSVLKVVTFSLAKSNDEKDASLLGFNSTTVFKYWKENKYEKLEEIRKEVAEAYGGLKVVEKTETFTADKDGDNEISENEQEEAEEQQKQIQNQQDFRVEFLKRARSWVIDNKLAWLNSSVTLEEFNKRTGKNAKAIASKKDKLKNAGKAIKKYGVAALVAGPAGVLIQKGVTSAYKAGKEKMAKDGTKVTVNSGTIAAKQVKAIKTAGITIGTGVAAIASKKAGNIKDIALNVLNRAKSNYIKAKEKVVGAFNTVKEGVSKTFNKVKDTAAKVGQKLTDIKDGVSNKIKSCIESISKFFKKLLENAKIKAIKGINVIRTISTKLLEAIKSEATKSKSFATEFVIKTLMFTTMLPVTISKAVILFLSGRKDPEKYLKISIEEKNEKIKMAGGIVALIESLMPYANTACMNHYGKTLRRLVFDVVISDTTEEKKDTYENEKAKILGLTVNAMLAYENKLNESSFGKKAKNFISNIFGGGADRTDAKLCGFSDITVFKFWREEKYEPLRSLEESIAHKFGDLDDLRSAVPNDLDVQSKFRKAYLREAKNYVKERGLEWLTYKTTKQELDERKKNKTLYIKSDKQVQQQKAEKEVEKPSFFKSIKNFFTSSNRDTRGKAKQSYQNKIGTINRDYSEIENTDTKSMSESLQKEYKYDKKAMNVMAQASNSIKSFWKSISPNFYGDQPKAKVSSDPNIKDDKVYAGNGGPENISGTNQGLVTKIRDREINYNQKSVANTRDVLLNKTNEVIGNIKDLDKKLSKTSDNDSYDINEKIPKAKIMNSIVNDFAKNFGNEINKRLDILEEMHKESLRHNKVSEEFFVSALKMLQIIASNSSNKPSQTMRSQLDNLINSLTR